MYRQLKAVTAKTGVPRAIVSDNRGDLHNGIERFRYRRHEMNLWGQTSPLVAVQSARSGRQASSAGRCGLGGRSLEAGLGGRAKVTSRMLLTRRSQAARIRKPGPRFMESALQEPPHGPREWRHRRRDRSQARTPRL